MAKEKQNEETAPADEEQIRKIQDSLAETRATLVASTDELRERAREVTDWRAWYRRKPGYFLLGAFVVGLYLGRR